MYVYLSRTNTIEPNGQVITKNRYCDLFSGDANISANGQDTLSDVSGTYGITRDMHVNGYVMRAVDEAIVHRTSKKVRKYERAVNGRGFNFQPLIYEIHSGARGPALVQFLTRRTDILARRLGRDAAFVYRHWSQRLSCIMRKQFACMMATRSSRVLNFFGPQHIELQLEGINMDVVVDPPDVRRD